MTQDFDEQADSLCSLLIRHLPFCLLIVCTGVVLYYHCLGAPFYFDDQQNIVTNGNIRNLGLAVERLLTPRGLAFFSFAIDYHNWGLSPKAFRIVNLLIHCLNALLVYTLVQTLTKDRFYSFWAGLIFIIHPLQTQSVTYIVQRMNLLAGLFFLLAVACYYFSRKRFLDAQLTGRWKPYLLYGGALFFGFCSIFSKQNTAVLPLVLFLVELFFLQPGKRINKGHFLYIMPFFLVPLAGIIAFWFDIIYREDLKKPLADFFLRDPSGSGRLVVADPDNLRIRYLLTQFVVLWKYIGLFFWPLNQVLDYCYPLVGKLLNWRSALGFSGLLGVAVVSWKVRWQKPLLSFGVCWFFLLLLVESSVIPLDPCFEHRLYLPLLGLILLTLSLFDSLMSKKLAGMLLVGACCVLAVLTWQRNQLWNDPVAIWSDNIAARPEAYRPYINLGWAYSIQGRFAEAESVLRDGLKLYPQSAKGHVNLGSVLDEMGQTEQAVTHFRKALFFGGDNFRAAFNLGVLYENAKEYSLAKDYYQLAIKYNPHSYKGYLGLGAVYYYQGNLEVALEQFALAKKYDSTVPEAVFNYASVALELGRADVARSYLPRLQQLDVGFYQQLLRDIAVAEMQPSK